MKLLTEELRKQPLPLYLQEQEMGLGIERHLHFKPMKLSEVKKLHATR